MASTKTVLLYQLNFLSLLTMIAQIKKPQKRRFWVRKIFRYRSKLGVSNTLVPELRLNDPEYFMQFLRMPIETFAKLLRLIEPDITKQNTRWRDAISAHDRLCLTLRFLATGETFRSLSYSFRVGRTTVTKIVRETSFAIWNRLKGTYMKVPQTEEEWQNIAEGFLERWQLPNCCGSIDGKHIVLQCPANTGSLNYNYKGRFSKILMAVADAHYKFIFVDFGHYGSKSDGGVFQKCTFGKKIINQTFNLPKDANLPNCD
ncbi:protein ALP1-like, partial [Centruroides sculpturatus]|uniref:protein ALP1-like n=1 Tax=Centruroides sculpturatus TaxID=218467 RepID=UPI000C6CE208